MDARALAGLGSANQRPTDLLRASATHRHWLAMLSSAALLSFGCRDLERFDSEPDEAYCGSIVQGEFIREGFTADLTVALQLDINQLQSRPGQLTTYDGDAGPCAPEPLFDAAPLRASPALLADALSVLEFGSGREYNFFAWVDSTCDGPMLAVVSLMRNDRVELRLLKPGTLGDADEDASGFGLFMLQATTQSACAPEGS